MKNICFKYLSVFVVVLLLSSCEKDDPVVPPGEELITTLRYTLQPTAGGSDIVMTFQDLDGDGGNDPTITGGTLAPNTSYTGSIVVLNESVSPTEDITAEIMEEDLDHQFFFQSTIAGLTVTYEDQDSNGNPLGLKSTLNTVDNASGTLTLTLRHEPNKSGAGVADGNIAEAGGETDVEVSFPIDVQ